MQLKQECGSLSTRKLHKHVSPSDPEPDIQNNRDENIKYFEPYSSVGAFVVNDKVFCTGVLLKDGKTILTAAHCLILLRFGEAPVYKISILEITKKFDLIKFCRFYSEEFYKTILKNEFDSNDFKYCRPVKS